MSVHCSLDEFPRCADWKHLVAGFRAPDCPIKVSLPCTGVYGSKACFSNVGAACQPVNIYDIEEGYADFLKHVTDGAELNLGEQRGDILNIDFTKLEDSHILVSGPPFPLIRILRTARTTKKSFTRCCRLSFTSPSVGSLHL